MIEFRATFSSGTAQQAPALPQISGSDVLITGRVSTPPGGPMVQLPPIKLAGTTEENGSRKTWEYAPIAVAPQLELSRDPIGPAVLRRCATYYFLDGNPPDFTFSTSGRSFAFKDGALQFPTGVPIPVCLVFPAPAKRDKMHLSFEGKEIPIR